MDEISSLLLDDELKHLLFRDNDIIELGICSDKNVLSVKRINNEYFLVLADIIKENKSSKGIIDEQIVPSIKIKNIVYYFGVTELTKNPTSIKEKHIIIPFADRKLIRKLLSGVRTGNRNLTDRTLNQIIISRPIEKFIRYLVSLDRA